MRAFSEHIARAGFEHFLFTGLPAATDNLQDHVVLNGWPTGWFDEYMSSGYYRHDPMAAFSRETVKPFIWAEVRYDPSRRATHRVMEAARSYGLSSGYSVPIVGARGEQACITMAGPERGLPKGMLPAIHLMSIYAYSQARDLLMGRHPPYERLSPREKEVLKWAAGGRSNWEIGVVLAISERAVRRHVQSAARKLGAASRTAAIVNAIRYREISVD